MVFRSSVNAGRPAPGSWLAGWLQRPHPDTFVCGVRWPEGAEPRAGKRWRYRRAWVDRWREGEATTIRFSDRSVVRIRLDVDPWWNGEGPSPRPGLVVLSGRSADVGARVLLAVPHGELARFGAESL